MKYKLNKSAHSVYSLHYHLVMVIKYRRKALYDEVIRERLKQIVWSLAEEIGIEIIAHEPAEDHLETAIQEIAEKLGSRVISLEVQPDHIHLFVSAPPRYSPSALINTFKGATSKRLRNKYPYLKSLPSMWTKTYYVGTAGNVSAKVIRRYIDECQDT